MQAYLLTTNNEFHEPDLSL